MLPASARLRRSADFAATVRRGRRGRTGLLLVHLLTPAMSEVDATTDGSTCGFVVSRAIGGSVVRHRVLRKLRHLVSPRLEQLPPGSRLVVRALPGAATASSAALGNALDRALRSVLGSPARSPHGETAARR